jgi:multisubunit Na+/H+ antiporter MnhC subunit
MEQPDDPEQREKWLRLPFIGIGISQQVKPLVDGSVLTAAVIKSLTMEFTLTLLVRAIETQAQLPERSVVEALSYPDLEKITAQQ